MPQKAVVIGGNGQLGSDLCAVWSSEGWSVSPLTHADISVEDFSSVSRVLTLIKPDIILNAAAYHNVPLCEADPQRAWQVNALGASNVTKVAEQIGARHFYYSTDYVFDGSKRQPYVETDRPAPLNAYGITKLAGEHFTLNGSERSCVVRVSGLYGKVPCRAKGGNFITTMIKAAKERPEVRVVDDEILTPTPTKAVAEISLDLAKLEATGVIHLSCEGSCSWYEFARLIFEIMHFSTPLVPVKSEMFPSPVKRPQYSVLENARAKGLGVRLMPRWDSGLLRFLREEFRTS